MCFYTSDKCRYATKKILFRQESGFIQPINSSIENFNKSLFVNNSYEETFTHDLFKLIISDKDFFPS